MYHRILMKVTDVSEIQPGMFVLAETFKINLEFLKNHFKIYPLNSLNDSFLFKKNNNKPICFITFDDGWLDFYKVAYPILKKHGAHATIFLPTGFIGGKKCFWPDRLLHLFKAIDKKTEIYLRDAQYKNKYVKNIVSCKGNYEEKTEKAISFLKQMREGEIDDILSELSIMLNIDVTPNERAFINWEEISEMKQSKLIDFGSHTVNHKILTTLTYDEINHELIESKETLIERNINDGKFVPFCYPSGVYDKKIEMMVQEAGYDVAVSTQKGWNSLKEHPFTLRRIGIHQDMTSTPAMFACKIAGLI
jgi:peptidoglycan/xylan/chitin deacetylase (PgdA/CDA1 family)